MHIFVRHKACLITLLESVIAHVTADSTRAPPSLLSTTLLELYLSHAADLEEGTVAAPLSSDASASSAAAAHPKPDQHSSSHPPPPPSKPVPTSPSTLPSRALQATAGEEEESAAAVEVISAEECRLRAGSLLEKGGAQGEEERALMLCQEHGLEEGAAILLERKGLYKELIQRLMESGDPDLVLAACRKWSTDDPMVWVSALHWLASLPTLHHDAVQTVLQEIEERELVPAIIVVQVLAQHPKSTLSLVKGYMARSIQKDLTYIAQDQKVIQDLQDETERMRNEIEEGRRTARVFQSRRCGVCGQALEVPSVHFMCSFEGAPCSFHARCLPDNSSHCPLCGPGPTAAAAASLSSSSSSAAASAFASAARGAVDPNKLQDQHELFFKHLRSQPAEGGKRFEALAQHFSKGLFPS